MATNLRHTATKGESRNGINESVLLKQYKLYTKNVMSAQTLDVSLFRAGTVIRLERDASSMVK